MIIASDDLDSGDLRAELVVVGAGPAGIVTALEAARRGVDVVLLESGSRTQQPATQQLAVATRRDPNLHAPVEVAVSRQIGGTSAIWGGRCVPYDPVDFIARPQVAGSEWPISYDELVAYFEKACEWMVCGRALFNVSGMTHLPAHLIPGLVDGDVTTSSLERWSLPTNFGEVYWRELSDNPRIRLVTNATCTRVVLDDTSTRSVGVECRTLAGRSFQVSADDVVLAAGGLESTRLLMCSKTGGGESLGNHSGQLGAWYMAHVEGVIADLVLTTAPRDTVVDYERDVDGSYVRRRFAFTTRYQLEHGLPNISGWIANPELSDASHGNAQLSFTYLALISPLGWMFAPPAQRMSLTGTKIPGTPYGTAARSSPWAHVRNLLRHPIDTVRFVFGFGFKRVFARGRKPPGFFVRNKRNRYPFQYHAEHLPHLDSRVRLSEAADELGMQRLDIDIRFTDADIEGVLAAHRHWDNFLRANGVGYLEYLSDDLPAAVRARTGGGFHQIGTTRMSSLPQDGVVDEDLRVHGVDNVYVVSSSVFVTSGQANSTFMIVVFALRLIDRLYADRTREGDARA